MASVTQNRRERIRAKLAAAKFDTANMAERVQKAAAKHQAEEKKLQKSLNPVKENVEKPIKVDAVEFYVMNNASEHHTNNYELAATSTPVLRRGQSFQMAIRFRRLFQSDKDTLKLLFTFGPRPNVARGTQAEIAVTFDKSFKKTDLSWEAIINHQDGPFINLFVKSPVTAGVGLWKCVIITGFKGKLKKKRFECPEDIYILFNPWCKDDAVYLEDESSRSEYVLNDVGKLYMGTFRVPNGRDWIFGQFDEVILPACLLLLNKAKLEYTFRGDPVKVVRAVSAMINSRDDEGLLEDNWSGDYSGGTAPMDWTGSLKIFEEYAKNGGQPVKYGQCWVFSGCATTMCRALGIPCRSVTNFVSAHDCHQNLTVDKFYDANGELTEMDENDAIWNFHVWNEVWMVRPDLPKGYGGWQVIDATPQEQSSDTYCLGPTSVEAVRKGEIGLQYDTMFVVSEVNADIIHWQEDEEAEIGYRQMRSQNYFIGKKILTKCKQQNDNCEDLISCYKNPEGSKEERLQLLNAARNAHLWYLYDTPISGAEDVEFDLIEIDEVMIGQPFNIEVLVKNKSDEPRNIFAVLSAVSIYYTGVTNRPVKRVKKEITLASKQSQSLKVGVSANDYLNKLVDYGMIKIRATASVQETRQSWAEEDDFIVKKPEMKVKVEQPAVVNQPLQVTWTLKNPLSISLERCRFSVEGPGFARPKIQQLKDVAGGETLAHSETFVPKKAGEKKVVATFSSNHIAEISGSTTISVAAN